MAAFDPDSQQRTGRISASYNPEQRKWKGSLSRSEESTSPDHHDDGASSSNSSRSSRREESGSLGFFHLLYYALRMKGGGPASSSGREPQWSVEELAEQLTRAQVRFSLHERQQYIMNVTGQSSVNASRHPESNRSSDDRLTVNPSPILSKRIAIRTLLASVDVGKVSDFLLETMSDLKKSREDLLALLSAPLTQRPFIAHRLIATAGKLVPPEFRQVPGLLPLPDDRCVVEQVLKTVANGSPCLYVLPDLCAALFNSQRFQLLRDFHNVGLGACLLEDSPMKYDDPWQKGELFGFFFRLAMTPLAAAAADKDEVALPMGILTELICASALLLVPIFSDEEKIQIYKTLRGQKEEHHKAARRRREQRKAFEAADPIKRNLVEEFFKKIRPVSAEEPDHEAAALHEPALEAAAWDEPAHEAAASDELAPEAAGSDEPAHEAVALDEPAHEATPLDELALKAAAWDEPAHEAAALDELAPEAAGSDEPAHETAALDEPAHEATPLDKLAQEAAAWDEPAPEAAAWDELAHEATALDELAHEAAEWDELAHEAAAWDEPAPEAAAWDEPAPEAAAWDEPAHEAETWDDLAHEAEALDEPDHEAVASDEPAPEAASSDEPARETAASNEPARETAASNELAHEATASDEPALEAAASDELYGEASPEDSSTAATPTDVVDDGENAGMCILQ